MQHLLESRPWSEFQKLLGKCRQSLPSFQASRADPALHWGSIPVGSARRNSFERAGISSQSTSVTNAQMRSRRFLSTTSCTISSDEPALKPDRHWTAPWANILRSTSGRGMNWQVPRFLITHSTWHSFSCQLRIVIAISSTNAKDDFLFRWWFCWNRRSHSCGGRQSCRTMEMFPSWLRHTETWKTVGKIQKQGQRI